MAAAPTPDARKALADRVKRRRIELGMTKDSVFKAAQLAARTYDRIEAGLPVRDAGYVRLEPVLGWASGSCVDVLDGGEPTLLEPTPVPGVAISPFSEAELAAIGQAVQDSAILIADGLPSDKIREIKRHVIEQLQKGGVLPEADQT